MVYFKVKDDYIYKYNISYDMDALNDLRDTIVKKCSLVEHIEYESDCDPSFDFLDSSIENYEIQSTDKVQEYFEGDRIIYHYSYDKYNHPYLVHLIDGLLRNDKKSLEKIFKYQPSKEKNIDDKIKSLKNKFNSIDSNNTSELRKILDDLDSLESLKGLNSKRESTNSYYKKVLSLIHFDLVSAIKKNEFDKVMDFIGDSDYSDLSKTYVKKIK